MSILSFADSKQISYEAAFKYLTMFKGINFLTEHHDIEHIQSRERQIESSIIHNRC